MKVASPPTACACMLAVRHRAVCTAQRALADGNPEYAGSSCSLSHRIAPARLVACSSTTARQRGPVEPPADSLVRLSTRFMLSLARLRLSCTDRACQSAQADRAQADHAQPFRASRPRPCRPRHADRAQLVRAQPVRAQPVRASRLRYSRLARGYRAHGAQGEAEQAEVAGGAHPAPARGRARRHHRARALCAPTGAAASLHAVATLARARTHARTHARSSSSRHPHRFHNLCVNYEYGRCTMRLIVE